MRSSLLPAVALSLGLAGAAAPQDLALVTPRPNPPEPFRFFGDRTVTVPLLLQAPEPGDLTLRAQLMQLSTHLVAPLAREIEVPLPAALSSRPAVVEINVPIALPAVKRETDLELRFHSRRQGRELQPAGRVALRVYPAALLDPIRAWARSHSIHVNDDGGPLTEFFRQHEIPVVKAGGSRGVTLYAGKLALEQWARSPLRAANTAVLFLEREPMIPHIVVDRTGQGTTIKVEMRLLDRLTADPLAQKIFLDLFRLLQEQDPHAKGGIE